ncbi:MAG: amino acid adenylation domain-containing protein, partial [Aldersonia sp.]|nr:amino acid adenylation domain-containing protein [Aldersonia sp.]
ADVFAEVLAADRVGLHDDFFALGGNSLLATLVVARLGAALDTSVPVRSIFEAPTVGRLAAVAERHTGTGRIALEAGLRPERVPLSLAQSRMWFLNRFDPASAVNNISMAVRLSGELDVAALQVAVADVIARHESLRTVYPEVDGVGYQQVLPAASVSVDLDPVPVAGAQVFADVAAVIERGFDVTTEVPLRARLLRLTDAPAEFVLVFVVHHIAGDGGSMGPLARDVMVAYEARSRGVEPGWAPLTVQYADYALWQRAVLGAEDDPGSLISQQIDYWTTTLAELPDEIGLPADRPRPAVASGRGASVEFAVDTELHSGLTTLARTHEATLFMVVHAALAVVLARLSGGDDVAVGTPIAGRGERELDDVIGMFVNTLVLRTSVDGGESFDALLARVRAADVAAFGHADVPFERLVEVLNPARSQARHPLFQVALAFQNLAQQEFALPGLRVSAVESPVTTAKFDLQVTLAEVGAGAGMAGSITYATDLFDAATVSKFADRLVRVLTAVAADATVPVGDIVLLDRIEAIALTHVHGAGVMASGTLGGILTAAVDEDRSAVAVRCDGVSYTYAELDDASNRLARLLLDRGARAETRIALALPRSYAMVVAVWAVAKTGAAFVPVDPTYPPERVTYMLADSGALLGVTAAEYAGGLPGAVEWLALDAPDVEAALDALPAGPVMGPTPVRHDNAAYLIYTSGSTGRPKGVTVTHAGLGGLLDTAAELYDLHPGARFLHICSPSFDPSVLEWCAAFSRGATLVIVPPHVIGGVELTELLANERVSHTIITPAVLSTVDPAGATDLQVVSVGGDASTPDLVSRWAPGRTYFNGYGPTETTIISSFARLEPGKPITIGAPIHGMSALVLDARLHPVPIGVPGELYLSGDALARGYHDRAGQTAGRFVANPFGVGGQRMYRTGDVVRWNGTGELEFVGRSDFQVKVRGFRVELGEIDQTLREHESVRFAVTLGKTLDSGATVLVAYVQPTVGAEIDTATLAEFVGDRLPGYMVPSAFVVIDQVPLTPIGKLDRKALPEPVFESVEFRAAETPMEQAIAEVMAQVLG